MKHRQTIDHWPAAAPWTDPVREWEGKERPGVDDLTD
jgi:hypothetical protein